MLLMPNGIEISEVDYKCLKNDLRDVEDWIQKAIEGKIHQCKTRLIREWQVRIAEDPSVDVVPAQIDDLVQYITGRVDYADRLERGD
jgi:hypothetical protein